MKKQLLFSTLIKKMVLPLIVNGMMCATGAYAQSAPFVSVVLNRADATYQEGDTAARYSVVLSQPALQNTMVSLVAQYVVDGAPADNCLGLTVTNNIVIPTGLTSSVPYTMTIKDGTVKTASGILITPTITNAAAQIQYSLTNTATIFIQNVAPGNIK